MTPAQLTTLKAAILIETDPAFVAARTNGQTPLMTEFFNAPSTFVVYKTSESMSAVGKTINYIAFEALTTASLEKLNTFKTLNPESVAPTRSDMRSFFANVFSGALGGQGQATRDALDALWRRFASRGEKLFATGPGTALSPGLLVFEGSISDSDIGAALEL